MTVQKIINEKGRDVVTISAETSLADIAGILAQRRIGAVVVVDGGAVSGIVSERDVVKALAVHGAEALRQTAQDCMTSRVVTCAPDDTIDTVMQKMTSGRFRHLPVLIDERLAGIVSIGDVVKWRIAEVQTETEQIRAYIATA